MRRRRNLDTYGKAGWEDIELLLAPGVTENAEKVALSVRRFLLFRNLKATITLPDGITLGRRASVV